MWRSELILSESWAFLSLAPLCLLLTDFLGESQLVGEELTLTLCWFSGLLTEATANQIWWVFSSVEATAFFYTSTRVLVGVIAIVLFCLPLLDIEEQRKRIELAGSIVFLPGNNSNENVSSASIKDIDPKDPPINIPYRRTGTAILSKVPLCLFISKITVLNYYLILWKWPEIPAWLIRQCTHIRGYG